MITKNLAGLRVLFYTPRFAPRGVVTSRGFPSTFAVDAFSPWTLDNQFVLNDGHTYQYNYLPTPALVTPQWKSDWQFALVHAPGSFVGGKSGGVLYNFAVRPGLVAKIFIV